MRPTAPLLVATALLAAGTLTACGGDSGSDSNTIKVSLQAVHGQPDQGDGHLSGRDEEAVREGQPGQEGRTRPDQGPGLRVLHEAPADAAFAADRARPGLRGHVPHQLRHHRRVLEAAGPVPGQVAGLGPVHRHGQVGGEGAGREDVRRPGRHGHPRPLVRQGDPGEGGGSRRPGSRRVGRRCSTRPGLSRRRSPTRSR